MSPIALSELSLLLQETIRRRFSATRYWVIAEISNHSYYPQKGFHYFELVEKSGTQLIAKIAAVAWTAGAGRIRVFEQLTRQSFRNGIGVCVEVTVDFHPVYGLKLTLTDIDAAHTLGRLELARQAVFAALLNDSPDMVWKDGDLLASFNQQLDLPIVVQRIALVGSLQSAGYADFLHSLTENPFGFRFKVDPFPVLVQGEENAAAFAGVMATVAEQALRSKVDYDAVVIVRGGGADTDLLLFDQLPAALAIASCPFPVITGIGHLKNESIADLVAHTALKTPTQVAEFLVQRNREFETSLVALQSAIATSVRQNLLSRKHTLERLGASIAARPGLLLLNKKHNLQHIAREILAAPVSFLQRRQQAINEIRRLCHIASPERTLERGFAWLEQDGKIITSADGLTNGDNFDVRLKDALLKTTLIQKTAYHGK
ncbi:exodeoxyribonuclease VII large subunit [Flavihumibacter petaseus]|uniref:Exodeoxyribonuclease 7 large subunit n=1 Tax=Flavihumibacter petaseus NBRC 106054 TaxID=1220578 RepID=A0A0E9MZC4_9BACT|nr:exodeoxyribonuclease VII large subunit [Flavihumibacter petaseus]GAO42450.1 putative exodeoxyribonuclease VII large subunit [Flavihumibacter petaseus NBRC 106054]